MDNVILDVVLGLSLLYAVLSLLAMSLQEVIAGGLMKSRVTELHALLREATGRDDALRERVLAHPLVFALYTEDSAKPHMLWRSGGPSAIPPDVFARALLAEIDPAAAGKPPSERFATPQAFVDELLRTGLGDKRTVGVLRSLLPGREASWPDFEAAVAAWFSHVGDRAKGWYKRRSTRTSFLIALALAGALNVDSFHVASALAGDPEVRAGVARLAERVSAEREASAGKPAPGGTTRAAEPLSAEARASAGLADAYSRLRPLYFRDDEIAAFGHQLVDVGVACKGMITNGGSQSKGRTRFVSNSDVWIDVLPVLQTRIELALAGSAEESREAKTLREDDIAKELRAHHRCLSHVSSWVRAATTASKDGAAQRAMQETAVALEDAKAALLELLRQRGAPQSIKRLFQSAPDAFGECVESESSLDAVRRCTEAQLDATARLPIGHSRYNRLRQFCVVRTASGSDSTPPPRDSGLLGVCDARDPGRSTVAENRLLGIPAMALTRGSGWDYVSWIAGLLVTTMFVMLGAPFWFDLLAKVVNIRAAGRRADAAETSAKGAGTLPLLQPAARPAAPAADTSAPLAPPPPVFSSGEVPLTRREIIALQQRIGVVPASGEMDAQTRLKLQEALEHAGLGKSDRITAAAYLALVGRAAVGGEPLVVGTIGRPMRHQPFAAAQALASSLGERLSLPPAQRQSLIPPTVGDFNDDLRALAVLYRYKSDTRQDRTAKVFALAADNPSALDQIDELLLNELLSPAQTPAFARHATAPWIDWAIGELGQVEAGANNRKASNPRICAYLDSVATSLGDAGDNTPWCAAFVNWVVRRHADLPSGPAFSAAPPNTASAAAWAQWGTATSTAAPNVGDVVVVKTTQSASGFHVGFCFEVDAQNGRVHVLGGNQTGGSRVSLSSFPLPVFAARR